MLWNYTFKSTFLSLQGKELRVVRDFVSVSLTAIWSNFDYYWPSLIPLMLWTQPSERQCAFPFWGPLAWFRNPLKLSEVNLSCCHIFIIIKAITHQEADWLIGCALCKLNPFPQQKKDVLMETQWQILIIMYAITLSNNAGQRLWRNDKNIKFNKPVLVWNHCHRKS